MQHGGAGWFSYGTLALVLLAVLVALWRSGFMARVMRLIEATMLGNWQLAVLGAAAIALSLASWYTTFDGLYHFTSAPLLSALVAFGVQGVMLIVSWLIGESFATGMSQRANPAGATRSAADRPISARETALAMALGAVLAGLAFCWALDRTEAVAIVARPGGIPEVRADWRRVAEVAVQFLAGLAGLGLLALVLRRGGETVRSYVQGLRLIARNAVLWVMLAACMTATVLFSFDSHFNAIFPAGQRRRAAEIRTLNQTAAIVADIGARARKVQAAEAKRLFETEAWNSSDSDLGALAAAARSVQGELEAALSARLEAQQRSIGEQRERIAGAERSESALLARRDGLESELRRLETSMGTLESELANAQAAYDAARRSIAAKEIEAAAEGGGVEGSGKPGKGPIWRQRMAEVSDLQRKLQIADEPRLTAAQRQRDAASARIVGLKREIATIIAEAAKYKGVIRAAAHRIAATETETGEGQQIRRTSAAHLVDAFERARSSFRQHPEAGTLATLQEQCAALQEAVSGVAAGRNRVLSIDCDLKAAAEAATRLLALNAGLQSFSTGCAGGSRLPQTAGTDALLAFGRKCLQDSGLASADTADFGARFQAIEMNRDDKAHRFVVTWNAFLDGNRLAYLALAIAIGIDSLVFMAGLFGAAASRSPLSDVPSRKARSAEQLEALVRSALGQDPPENAELVLAALRPAPGDDDQRSELDLTGCDAGDAERIRKVLVAGRSIGAVERVSAPTDGERYLVRPELIEFLSTVASAARDDQRAQSDRARLVRIVGAALGPDQPGDAAIVLRHAEPIAPRRGFVARLDLAAVGKEKERRLIQGVLSAGMSVGAVGRGGAFDWLRQGRLVPAAATPTGRSEQTYLIGSALFETLLHFRASGPSSVPALQRQPRPVQLTAIDVPSKRASDVAFDEPAVPSVRLLADARLSAAQTPSEPDDEGRRRGFREVLLRDVMSESRTAIASLCRRPDGQRDARTDLERIAREAARALQRATRSLARSLGSDARALAALEETSGEVGVRIPVLLNELLEDLIGEAERSGDDSLLSRLGRLRNGLAMLADR
ncbi:MAG TPA: hypothetical protein VFZ16_12225 [Hyphomicrobiaceae bacterium]|nr:hypothetical protein [Hyphomicrobiaceae bacterium]